MEYGDDVTRDVDRALLRMHRSGEDSRGRPLLPQVIFHLAIVTEFKSTVILHSPGWSTMIKNNLP